MVMGCSDDAHHLSNPNPSGGREAKGVAGLYTPFPTSPRAGQARSFLRHSYLPGKNTGSGRHTGLPSWAHMSLSWGWRSPGWPPLEKCGSWKATLSSKRLPRQGQVAGKRDAEPGLTRGGPKASPGRWGPGVLLQTGL